MENNQVLQAKARAEAELSRLAQGIVGKFQRETGRVVLEIKDDSPGAAGVARKIKLSLLLQQ